jgi:DNA-binding response OmpR family regulator
MDRILLVDDEQDLVWALRHGLNDEGYEVLTAYDGVEALAIARHHRPDLIILDIAMPRLDGLQTCYRLRRDPTMGAVPILFLSALNNVEDRVQGLEEGGDDYLVKPFALQELKARVRALLRRSRPAPNGGPRSEGRSSWLVVDPLTLDLSTRQVRVGERSRQLTPAEFDLLHYLMLHPGEIFPSQQLLEQVWNYPSETGDPGLVRWHIKNLRAKIEPNPTHPTYLRTVPHHGYILVKHEA